MHWLIGGCGGPETHLWQGMVDSQPLNKIHRMPASLAKNVKFLHPWSWKHKYWQFSALFILRFSDSMAMTFSTTNGQTVPLFTKSQVSCMPFVMARKLKKDNMILTMSSFTCWRYSLLNWLIVVVCEKFTETVWGLRTQRNAAYVRHFELSRSTQRWRIFVKFTFYAFCNDFSSIIVYETFLLIFLQK